MGRRTRPRMLALVRQWETSGETRRAFAQRHGVTLSCFDYWRRQVLDARQEAPDVAFAPVRVVDEPEAARHGVIEVALAGGERLVIREGVSDDLVRHVIAALRSSCRRSRRRCGSTSRPAPRICAARLMAWPPWCASAWISIRSRVSGHLFLFRNRRGDRLKILAWDQGGFWVLYKRLERGTFAWPDEQGDAPVTLRSADLLLLLSGMDLAHTRRRRWYDRVAS